MIDSLMEFYRKRPLVVAAFQWFVPGDSRHNPEWIRSKIVTEFTPSPGGDKFYYVKSVRGEQVIITHGDWIVREPDGAHYYPCKPDVFEATYEKLLA